MFDAPVDVERLTKPEADAFRYIAQALGARFAGDMAAGPMEDVSAGDQHKVAAVAPLRGGYKDLAQATTPPAGAAPPDRVRSGSFDSTAPRDASLARALDAVPLPLIVADGDTVLFVNRTALAELGHSSADIINAAGGLGALFDRRAKRRGALVPLLTAAGENMLARVTLATVGWAGGRAVLISIDPQAAALDTAEAAARMFQSDGVTASALRAALEVMAHPAAIITAEGDALATNAGYTALQDSLAAIGISPLVSQTALHALTHRALASVDGTVQCSDRILLGERVYTARAMALGPFPACAMALLPVEEADLAPQEPPRARLIPPAPSNDVVPTQRSVVDVVHKVRAAVTGLAVLYVGECGHQTVAAPVGDALERLAAALADQCRVRSVVTVRQHGTSIRITGAGAIAQPLDDSLDLCLSGGGEEGLAVRVVRHGAGDVSIAPLGT